MAGPAALKGAGPQQPQGEVQRAPRPAHQAPVPTHLPPPILKRSKDTGHQQPPRCRSLRKSRFQVQAVVTGEGKTLWPSVILPATGPWPHLGGHRVILYQDGWTSCGHATLESGSVPVPRPCPAQPPLSALRGCLQCDLCIPGHDGHGHPRPPVPGSGLRHPLLYPRQTPPIKCNPHTSEPFVLRQSHTKPA